MNRNKKGDGKYLNRREMVKGSGKVDSSEKLRYVMISVRSFTAASHFLCGIVASHSAQV